MSTLKALFRSQKAATTPVAQKQSLKVGMDALPLCQKDRNLTLDFDNAFLLESLCSIGQRTRDTAEADIVETKDVDSESPGKFWQINVRKKPRSKENSTPAEDVKGTTAVVVEEVVLDNKAEDSRTRPISPDSEATLPSDPPAGSEGPEIAQKTPKKAGRRRAEVLVVEETVEQAELILPASPAGAPLPVALEVPQQLDREDVLQHEEPEDLPNPVLSLPVNPTVVLPIPAKPALSTPKSARTSFAGSSPLLLPEPLELLYKFFDELETFVRFCRSRSAPCLLSKCKRQVENVVKRTFEIPHLQQIVHLFPEAYTFTALNPAESWERNLSLVIEIKDLPDDDLPETMLAVATASEKRLRTFRERLCDFATPFLKPGAKPSPRRLPEWDLEGLPDVPREQIAVANASRKRSEETAAQAVAQVPSAASPTDSSAKPKATTLLERIRAKEQAKELERKAKHALDSLGNGSVSERAMNSRMIELAKALSALFLSKGKTVLIMTAVVDHVAGNMRMPLSQAEATNHILTLSRLHPEFCWITESASGRLLRLDRGKLAAVIDPVSR